MVADEVFAAGDKKSGKSKSKTASGSKKVAKSDKSDKGDKPMDKDDQPAATNDPFKKDTNDPFGVGSGDKKDAKKGKAAPPPKRSRRATTRTIKRRWRVAGSERSSHNSLCWRVNAPTCFLTMNGTEDQRWPWRAGPIAGCLAPPAQHTGGCYSCEGRVILRQLSGLASATISIRRFAAVFSILSLNRQNAAVVLQHMVDSATARMDVRSRPSAAILKQMPVKRHKKQFAGILQFWHTACMFLEAPWW